MHGARLGAGGVGAELGTQGRFVLREQRWGKHGDKLGAANSRARLDVLGECGCQCGTTS